jgi:muconolactone delta-isomerase
VIVLATGSISDLDALAPFVEEESRVAGELKAEGVVKAVYRRSAALGAYFLLEGTDLDEIRGRIETLPFVIKGLMTLDYEEIHEI